ncbi:lactadherin-like isoform X2 [Ostrea edulis]|uniref:lactadherin-like isoform X2 n=1 Tax=Ostrea edulis TaxID=37623 RepID=UPI0024AF9A85|nr:lactadherin-like isoform X2 [Ostrea edulis]
MAVKSEQMAKPRLITLALFVLCFGLINGNVCGTNGPLGMISGSILDWQITASSTYPLEWDKKCAEKYARVYLPNKYGWCAKYKSSSEWLKVDLGVAARVTGVMTQGRGDGKEWVTSFKVSYSMDDYNELYVTDQYGNHRVFEGNTDAYSVKHTYLDRPIIARYIKFHTVHWHRHPSMRVEILGYQLCKENIGLPPYGRITTSSNGKNKRKDSCQPEDGNILSKKGWCAKRNNVNQWLQIDVGPPTLITGVLTKGRGDSKKKHWVKRFKISYSNDTQRWYEYKDAHSADPRLFGGNSDKDNVRIHYINSPFVARFVRFHPLEWNGKISMRAGLLGCPHTAGNCGESFMRVNDDTPCVENLAYKKQAWINGKNPKKRHITQKIVRGHPDRAVDGKIDFDLHSCTILDNLYGDTPVWTVDLGSKTSVSGVIIYTWQGSGEQKVKEGSAMKDYLNNLDRLVMYVDNKSKAEDASSLSGNMCGYVSKINGALYSHKIHVQCVRPQKGRYVRVEAWGSHNSWSRLFSAVLCEVLVYA